MSGCRFLFHPLLQFSIFSTSLVFFVGSCRDDEQNSSPDFVTRVSHFASNCYVVAVGLVDGSRFSNAFSAHLQETEK